MKVDKQNRINKTEWLVVITEGGTQHFFKASATTADTIFDSSRKAVIPTHFAPSTTANRVQLNVSQAQQQPFYKTLA